MGFQNSGIAIFSPGSSTNTLTTGIGRLVHWLVATGSGVDGPQSIVGQERRRYSAKMIDMEKLACDVPFPCSAGG